MKIEQISVESLIPYAKNARIHSDDQVAQIAGSIREFGFNNPVLIDDANGIIAGHGRVLAARKLGMTKVPAIRLLHLSDAQRRAFIIADNKLAINAGWDEAMLKAELDALVAEDFDASLTGFSEADIESLGGGGPGNEVDAEPRTEEGDELREKWGVESGQIWKIGEHRIACGDSTDVETVSRLLGNEKPHLMVTDPPYGVNYDANWRNEADRANGKPYGARAIGLVQNDEESDWTEAWTLFPGDVCYCWHAGRHASIVQSSLEASGFQIRAQIIWAKNNFAISRGDYHWQHEPCWYAVRKGKTAHWSGDRSQTTLWEIDKPLKSETGHSTQKPVECMERPIRNNSKPGDLIYDPFSGSGTTIIACERTGRKCRAVEISPAYVAIAIQRWVDATGGEPKLVP